MPEATKAPGLIWRKRRDGSRLAYWSARPDLIKAGYLPKMVRLHYAPDDPALVERCRVLQAEMLAWSVERRHGPIAFYDGTCESLVRFYETHPDSPYHNTLRPTTQRTYSKTMALLMKHKGKRRVADVKGSDVGRWYRELAEASSKGWAYYVINVWKTVLSFGASMRIAECKVLRDELREVRFSAGKRREEQVTFQQVQSCYDAAPALGLEWMARTLVLQFDFCLRRRDVIGEYILDIEGEGAIRAGKKVWRDGLTWDLIDKQGMFKRLVSKTAFTSGKLSLHVVSDYPMLERELAKTPPDQRIGPIVINPKTGLPPTEAQCRRAFRKLAKAVGIPDTVWNMDARAGANTEAYNAGTTQDERLALATHAEPATNEIYIRDVISMSRSAAAKRVASRKA